MHGSVSEIPDGQAWELEFGYLRYRNKSIGYAALTPGLRTCRSPRLIGQLQPSQINELQLQ